MARRDDDDYDDDDRAAPRRQERSSGGMPMWPFFLLGGFLLLIVVCGGGVFGIFYFVKSKVSNLVSQIPSAPGTKQATDAEITDALNDLKGPNKVFPLLRITGFKADPNRQDEVCKALEPLLNDSTVASQAAQALAIWGTPKSCTALHTALQNQDQLFRWEVIKALGAIKSEQSAGPLAARLNNSGDMHEAGVALKKIGPKAEKEVVKFLENKDNDEFARQEACNILAEIGTKNGSLPALKKAEIEPNKFMLNNAAKTAITSINRR